MERIELRPALVFCEFGDDGKVSINAFVGFDTVNDVNDPQQRTKAPDNRDECQDTSNHKLSDTQNKGGDCVVLDERSVFLVVHQQGDDGEKRCDQEVQKSPQPVITAYFRILYWGWYILL